MIPSCLANIDCSIYEVAEAGDHFFVSGLVKEAMYNDNGSPLVFLGGTYGQFKGVN